MIHEPQPAGSVLDRPPLQERTSRSSLLLVLAVVAVSSGVFVRIDGFNRKSFWADEVTTVQRVSVPLPQLISELRTSPFPPLYYLTLKGWVNVCGLSDFSVRLLPVLLSLLAIPATYFVWKDVVGHRAAGWATVLLALNGYHVFYSQDAKMYAAVWLLSLLSSGFFLRSLFGQPFHSRWLVAYTITNACLPLVSYVGIVPGIIQAAFGVVLFLKSAGRRIALLRLSVAWMISVVPSLFWLPVALENAARRTGIEWIPPVKLRDIPLDLLGFIGNFLLGYRNSGQSPNSGWGMLFAVVYYPCIAAAFLLMFRLLFRREQPSGSVVHGIGMPDSVVIAYFALWLLAPIFGVLFFSMAVYPLWGVSRYLMASAPAVVLWLASSISACRRSSHGFAVGAAVVAVNILLIAFDRVHQTRTPWREVARTLSEAGLVLTATETRTEPGRQNLLVSSLAGHHVDDLCLEHAQREDAEGRVRIVVVPMADACSVNKPFCIVEQHGKSSQATEELLRDRVPGFEFRPIFSAVVHEEFYTAMPNPLGFHVTVVWLCVPQKR